MIKKKSAVTDVESPNTGLANLSEVSLCGKEACSAQFHLPESAGQRIGERYVRPYC